MLLVALDVPRLTALAEVRDDVAALRALISSITVGGPATVRKRTAALKVALLAQLARGEPPTRVLALAEVARLDFPHVEEVEWAVSPLTYAAHGRARLESPISQVLQGTSRCVIGGVRLLPHWRERIGWPQAMLDEQIGYLGPRWDHNFHDDAGVAVARAVLSTAKHQPPAGVEHGRTLPEVVQRVSLGGVVEAWQLPWLVAAGVAAASRDLDRLLRFYEQCGRRRLHVVTAPTDL